MLDLVELETALEQMFRCPPTQEQLDEFGAFDTLEEAIEAAAVSEDAELVRTVVSFYQVFLGRLPDEAGLDFWVLVLKDGTLTLQDLSSTFAASPEFDALYGNLTVEGIVREMYRNNLDRDPLNSDELDVEGFEFWVDVTNARIAAFIDAGLSPEDARDEAFEQLAIDFTLASETQDVVFGPLLDAYMINLGNGEQAFADPADLGAADTLFDVIEGSGEVELEGGQIGGNANRHFLHVESVPGATTIENAPFVLAGSSADVDALRLTGDAALRIDLTDPREQLEQIDLDGDGVIIPGETDFDVRDLVDLQFMEIIDAHPRGPALLDPTDTDNGFTGDLYIDGTGFAGDGVSTNGNIILGGYGKDVIFTGDGNDFISSGGLDDIIKAGRNADFIFQELGTIDDLLVFGDRPEDPFNGGVFAGDDLEIDGGSTFDDDPGQDSDWLLLEAGDDEEPVVVLLEFPGADVPEDGTIGTRLGNDGADIKDIENVNASGNFYKFLDIRLIQSSSTALVGYGDFLDADEAAGLSEGYTFRTVGGDFTVTRAAIEAFNGGAGVASVQDLRDLTQATLDAEAGVGAFTVAVADDPNSTDATGPVVFVTANLSEFFFDDDPILNSVEDELARGQAFEETELAGGLFDDLFFGDNRDFSPEEEIFRVPGLSPGVTAQMEIFGSSEDNIIIAGYDNDIVRDTLGGNDLFFGGDLEFLLTHQHNPNLFDLISDTISVNGSDGIADVGRDTLEGGRGEDAIHWDATGGSFLGAGPDAPGLENPIPSTEPFVGGETEFFEDSLFVTTFSVGRLTSISRSTDGSQVQFLAVNGIGEVADQDLTGAGERDDELATLDLLTDGDNVLRFDLGVGAGDDYQGNGIDPTFVNPVGDVAFVGLNGADRAGTADQTHYGPAFDPSIVQDFEHFNASGLSKTLDYLAAGTNDPELLFENQQNYRGTNADIDIRGIDRSTSEDETEGEDLDRGDSLYDNDFSMSQLIAEFNVLSVDDEGNPLAALVYSASNDGGASFARDTGDADLRLPSALNDFQTRADNKLFTSRGDDVLEGRGGNDWLEGRENTQLPNGDVLGDSFIISLNDGDNVFEGNPFFQLKFVTSPGQSIEIGDTIVGNVSGATAELVAILDGNGNLISQTPDEEVVFEESPEECFFMIVTNVEGDFPINESLRDSDDIANGFMGRLLDIGPFQQDNTIFGDDVNIIARRLDDDANGLVDEIDGRVVLGRDFRPFIGESVDPDTRLSVFQVQPIGGEADTFDIPGGVDDWSSFIGLTFRDTNGNDILSVTLNQAVANASAAAPALEIALNNAAGANIFDVSPAASVEDPDTSETDADGGFLDAVLIKFDASAAAAAGFPIDPDREPVATFTSQENAGFGVLQLPDEVTPGEVNRQTEDDEIVFRAYQNRLDDESVPDQQASLGLEAYAEDLVVGVEDGTTKLVEGQEYRIFIDDLKDNDTVTLMINGISYTLTVGFDPVTGEDITGESTDDFLSRFADFINDLNILRDPHSRVGFMDVAFFDPTDGAINDADGENGAGLIIREKDIAIDDAEHVFLSFPKVTIANNSGGDAPSVVVKETSDTSVVLYDYDFRDLETDGLNRGVGVNEQRDGGTDNDLHTRFITFEDSTGLNRAILQDADDSGVVVDGLDILTFGEETDFPLDEPFAPGNELLLQDALAGGIGDVDAFLAHDDSGDPGTVPGNASGLIGQPDAGPFSGLHGDDNQRGGKGIDTLLGETGDDRQHAGANGDPDMFLEIYNGGVNIVVDNATGRIIEEENVSGLAQVAGDDETLLQFNDTLIIEEADIDESEGDRFARNSVFIVAITGVAEDFGFDGTLAVDDDEDGLIEHTATILNMEVVRTLSNTEMDVLDFSGANLNGAGVLYDNTFNVGDTEIEDGDGRVGIGQLQGFESIIGTVNNDTLLGGNQNETLVGGDGDDLLDGGFGNDELIGGGGNDTLLGAVSNDILLGGGGNDLIRGQEGDDTLEGGSGDDTLDGGGGDDLLDGGDGCDTLIDGNGDDLLIGGGNDDLFATVILPDDKPASDFITPPPTEPTLFDQIIAVMAVGGGSSEGLDTLRGGPGDDVFLIGSDGNRDEIDGGSGDDFAHLFDSPDDPPTPFDDDILDPDSLVIGITDLEDVSDGDPLILTFFGDTDEPGPDEDDQSERFILTFLIQDEQGRMKTVVEDIETGPVADNTMAEEVAIAVQDALNSRGYSATQVGDTVEVTEGPNGGKVLFQNAEVIDADIDLVAGTGLGVSANQGEGITVDLRSSTIEADKFNMNGGDAILGPNTFDYDDLIISGAGSIIFAADGPGGPITNPLEDVNLDPSSFGLMDGGVTIVGDVLSTMEIDDTLIGNDDGWSEVFDGGGGNDLIEGLGGDDMIDGGSGDDTLDGGSGDDTIEGGGGDDDILGGSGGDSILGGSGDDTIDGGSGVDIIDGEDGDDEILAGSGADLITGGDGSDMLFGEAGVDNISGGSGEDTIEGGDDRDIISGNAGNDDLSGDGGDDDLEGGSGNDLIDGGAGMDFIDGGSGSDTIAGGADADTFDLNEQADSRPTAAGPDVYTDVTHGEDMFDIVGLGDAWQEGINDGLLEIEVISASIPAEVEDMFGGFGLGPWDVLIIEDGADFFAIIDFDSAGGDDDVFSQGDLAFRGTDGSGAGNDGLAGVWDSIFTFDD